MSRSPIGGRAAMTPSTDTVAARAATGAALEMLDVHRRFGDVRALDGARLRVRTRSVHALLGENGAGKTTLMRAAYGLLRPDSGTMVVSGASGWPRSPAEAIASGIGMVQQHFALVHAMTVAENVALGGRGGLDLAATARRVREIGEATGLRLDPDAVAGTLGVGAQQRLEIVKALARGARLLVLDEPTAVLAPSEGAELLGWLRRFADGGGAVVLITHKLRDALAVADDVTVLRRGRTVLARPVAGANERLLAAAMLGETEEDVAPGDVTSREPSRASGAAVRAADGDAGVPGRVVLAAEGATVEDEQGVERLVGATCAVRAGEIVGVAGVEGSGHRELLRLLAGRMRPSSGTVIAPPNVGFVPEDRHEDAVIETFDLAENVALRGAGERRGRVGWRGIQAETRELMTRRDVRAPSPGVPLASLSGGNQQKLVLARELAGAPAALLAESPTRGLDIQAARALLGGLRDARSSGAAVVVYSSDLDELLSIADRVLVTFAGRLTEVEDPTAERVGRAMLGVE